MSKVFGGNRFLLIRPAHGGKGAEEDIVCCCGKDVEDNSDKEGVFEGVGFDDPSADESADHPREVPGDHGDGMGHGLFLFSHDLHGEITVQRLIHIHKGGPDEKGAYSQGKMIGQGHDQHKGEREELSQNDPVDHTEIPGEERRAHHSDEHEYLKDGKIEADSI